MSPTRGAWQFLEIRKKEMHGKKGSKEREGYSAALKNIKVCLFEEQPPRHHNRAWCNALQRPVSDRDIINNVTIIIEKAIKGTLNANTVTASVRIPSALMFHTFPSKHYVKQSLCEDTVIRHGHQE